MSEALTVVRYLDYSVKYEDAKRRASPGTRLVSVEPDGPFHGLEELKHMATALVPAIVDPTLAEVGARSVVVVLPDGGDRYLSERFWRER